ncbi:2-keto-4-pentenoate hydratase [Salinicoccus halitifaciens]|uniref:2-keto-4-pentenoate hydratase n=1 Tax=Salinicoccus halitifaciens TaxID=1073415 RepID=A0ABV2EC18_9STAP|nr:fumarylacetoacetate hydrolase family protein [Salinicoccus halitifaciens]MCD2137593.1 fumarylacetoacetate hydrolase family protein [Salinicoccus halitifaciens]
MLDERQKHLAALLRQSKYDRKSISSLTAGSIDLSIDSAYHIQLENIKYEMKQGREITGKKIGLTSKKVQEMLGVDEPDYGHLLDDMEIDDGGSISFRQLLQPKVEGELAFRLKEDLKGPGVTSMDVLKATDRIFPSIEVVDSRIKDWKISLIDTVADNASAGYFVLGKTGRKVTDVDVKKVEMALYRNGQLLNTGVGTAALGNPAYCVAWLANKLSNYNIPLKAGEVILSGALSGMVEVKPGDKVRAEFSELGEVEVSFTY